MGMNGIWAAQDAIKEILKDGAGTGMAFEIAELVEPGRARDFIKSCHHGSYAVTVSKLSAVWRGGSSSQGVCFYLGTETQEKTLEGVKEALQKLNDVVEGLLGMISSELNVGKAMVKTLMPTDRWGMVWIQLYIPTGGEGGSEDTSFEDFITFDDELFLTADGEQLAVMKP